MERVRIQSSAGDYDVCVGHRLLDHLPSILADSDLQRPTSIVSNTTVGPLYAERAATAFGPAQPIELPDGETHKRWPQVEHLCLAWLEQSVTRQDAVMAIGGGVCTDTVGFASAVYLRGIDWIAVPTSLLAMVDASVGGKTGVNLSVGKNLVGAFWPPRLVVADVATLETLPSREIGAGLAEAVKTAWLGDRRLLATIEGCGTSFSDAEVASWSKLVLGCIRVKAQVVAEDEHEAGVRRKLNFGHTLGHALEAATDYRRFLHGEAVAWGMLAVAEISRRRGLLGSEHHAELGRAIASVGALPPIVDLDFDTVDSHIGNDKKRDEGGIAWVLPTDQGVLIDQRIDRHELEAVFESLKY